MKTLKRYKVIVPIAVNAYSPQEAVLKVNAMLNHGYYDGMFLRYSAMPDAPEPFVEELSSTGGDHVPNA